MPLKPQYSNTKLEEDRDDFGDVYSPVRGILAKNAVNSKNSVEIPVDA